MHAVVPTDREVSVSFVPPALPAARRVAEVAETSALRTRLAAALEREANSIAARWESRAAALVSDAAVRPEHEVADPLRGASATQAVSLVHALATALAADEVFAADDEAVGEALGTSAFDAGATVSQLLRTIDSLVAFCFDVVEDEVARVAGDAAAAEGVRACRRLRQSAASVALGAVRNHSRAVDAALQERFRRLRHDLRNPVSTIRSALELMADETVPAETRASPRFRAMIERNAAALDQLIVARLSDAEARVVPPRPRAGEPVSASFRLSESRDDLARPRERDDRQAGSL